MALYTKRPDRLIVPRWREFKETALAKELTKFRLDTGVIEVRHKVDQQLTAWQKEPSFINAVELINSASSANQLEKAKSAAELIVEKFPNASPSILKIANTIIDPAFDSSSNVSSVKGDLNNIFKIVGARIKENRSALSKCPHNAMRWVDLARLYTIIGKIEAAESAIKTAIHLAKENVFVIRCAIRFFIHKNDEDSLKYALNLIRKNPITKHDPWVLATEIALSAYLKKTSNLMKVGLQMIGSNNYSPYSTSELSSALATEEMKHYTHGKSRDLFRLALRRPNENSLAQAEWATNQIGALPLDFNVQNSFEAKSYSNYRNGLWDDSFKDAIDWIFDEPFSREPVTHASYLAGAIMDDNEKAIQICNFGLNANPQSFALLNNKAYSLAVTGKVEDAAKTMKQISINSLNENEKVTYTATKGLIFYCNGNREYGDSFYNQANEMALKNKNPILSSLVKAYKVRAQFLKGYNELNEIQAIDLLQKDFNKYQNPVMGKIIENLKNRLASQSALIL